MAIHPQQFHRRSFIHARLQAAGAEFIDIGGAAVASRFPGRQAPALALTDLSPLPRIGIKGPRALACLEAAGWPVPAAGNAAVAHAEGHQVARLADSEAWVLAAVDGDGAAVHQLASAVPGQGAWVVPRASSHCWFRLRGAQSVECLQKLCGVDLRTHAFPAGAIAQTSIARLNGVLVRDCRAQHDYHLLVDSASADWFWDVLLDAMEEFGGGPTGIHE